MKAGVDGEPDTSRSQQLAQLARLHGSVWHACPTYSEGHLHGDMLEGVANGCSEWLQPLHPVVGSFRIMILCFFKRV